VYQKNGEMKEVTHLGCWEHTRREFALALENEKTRAEKTLLIIQQLYAVKRQVKQDVCKTVQVMELRFEKSSTIINELVNSIEALVRNVVTVILGLF